ncbi:MAG: response regulator [Bacteroidia bacterium]|nr:response regulator [Bacteroidia bacterium]
MKKPFDGKILVVDDDPYILMSLDFLFRKKGYDVLVARNGTEALDFLQKEPIAIVLLDIMMPDVDGYEIARRIKSSELQKDCRIVFISAKTSETDIQKGYDAGASLYVCKPFSTRDLMKQIEELV